MDEMECYIKEMDELRMLLQFEEEVQEECNAWTFGFPVVLHHATCSSPSLLPEEEMELLTEEYIFYIHVGNILDKLLPQLTIPKKSPIFLTGLYSPFD